MLACSEHASSSFKFCAKARYSAQMTRIPDIKRKKSRSHKTKKCLLAKAAMLAAKAAKRKKKV